MRNSARCKITSRRRGRNSSTANLRASGASAAKGLGGLPIADQHCTASPPAASPRSWLRPPPREQLFPACRKDTLYLVALTGSTRASASWRKAGAETSTRNGDHCTALYRTVASRTESVVKMGSTPYSVGSQRDSAPEADSKIT